MLLPEREWNRKSGHQEALRLDFELEPSATGGLTVDASCNNPALVDSSSDADDSEGAAEGREELEALAQLNLRRGDAEEADEPDDLQIE